MTFLMSEDTMILSCRMRLAEFTSKGCFGVLTRDEMAVFKL